MQTASYPWVLGLERPLTQRVKWYSKEDHWQQELCRWPEQVEVFNGTGDRWFVTAAETLRGDSDAEADLEFLIWHILPRQELRGHLPGILSITTIIELLELDAEDTVVLRLAS